MQFPTHNHEILSFLRQLRVSLDYMSDEESLDRFRALCSLFGELHDFEYRTINQQVTVAQGGIEIRFPMPFPRIKLEHIACNYTNWLLNKYTLDGFVNVAHDDIVVDCGAFVGGFSLACIKIAQMLIAIEPSSQNYFCLEKNLSSYMNCLSLKFALGDQPGIQRLNCSRSAVEHSLLQPDDDTVEHQELVGVSRLDGLLSTIGIKSIDFLKVEAEGFEPEVIKGMGLLRPSKIAIDVSPERDGLSPVGEISCYLQMIGYECRQRAHVLFARII